MSDGDRDDRIEADSEDEIAASASKDAPGVEAPDSDGELAGDSDQPADGDDDDAADSRAGGDRDSRPEWLSELLVDEIDIKDGLRSALDPPSASETKDITRRVQEIIREETKGQFFSDGWSTSTAPRATFLVTSLLMLIIVVLAWLLLAPTGFELSVPR